MMIGRKRDWELPERETTPETVYRDRRRFMQGAAAGAILAGTPLGAGATLIGDDPTRVGTRSNAIPRTCSIGR